MCSADHYRVRSFFLCFLQAIIADRWARSLPRRSCRWVRCRLRSARRWRGDGLACLARKARTLIVPAILNLTKPLT